MILEIGQMNTGEILTEKIFNIHNKLGNDSPAFSEFRNKEIVKKEFFISRFILDYFENLDSVTIIGSRFPINYTMFLNSLGVDNITVIDYHPMLQKHKQHLNSKVIIKRPLFDNLNEYVIDSDLVIFPNTEYLVPLKMLSYYKNCKNVVAVNHINMQHNFNNYRINNEYTFAEDCNLSSVENFKVSFNSKCYMAYGTNTAL